MSGLPARRAFLRYWATSQQIEIQVPLSCNAHLFDRDPWVEIEWPAMTAAPGYPKLYEKARALGMLHCPTARSLQELKQRKGVGA